VFSPRAKKETVLVTFSPPPSYDATYREFAGGYQQQNYHCYKSSSNDNCQVYQSPLESPPAQLNTSHDGHLLPEFYLDVSSEDVQYDSYDSSNKMSDATSNMRPDFASDADFSVEPSTDMSDFDFNEMSSAFSFSDYDTSEDEKMGQTSSKITAVYGLDFTFQNPVEFSPSSIPLPTYEADDGDVDMDSNRTFSPAPPASLLPASPTPSAVYLPPVRQVTSASFTKLPTSVCADKKKGRRVGPYSARKNKAKTSPTTGSGVTKTTDRTVSISFTTGRKKDTVGDCKGFPVVTIRRDTDNTFRLRDRSQKVARRPRYLYVKVATQKASKLSFAFDLYGAASEVSTTSIPLPQSANLPHKMIKCRSSVNSAVFRVEVTHAIIPSNYSRQGTHWFMLCVRMAGTRNKVASRRFAVQWHVQK